jgi:polysaccharide biosynthesis/export protein
MKKTISLLLVSFLAGAAIPVSAMPQGAPAAAGVRVTQQPTGQSTVAATTGLEYVIGPEDVLRINVWREPELSVEVTVRPDGKIGLPLLNDIQAAGLTPTQLQTNITEGIRRFVSGPSVSVMVIEIRSQIVYITGAVGKPGVYVLGGPMTIMELLIRAGGLAEFAKSEEIQILRTEGGVTRQTRFNYKHFIEGRDYQQNVYLRTKDMVIVP